MEKRRQIKKEKDGKTVPQTHVQLERAEDWFWQKFSQASSPRIKIARLRIWFIFVFLRYGALRLKEIFNLDFSQLDFKASAIFLYRNGHSREVPFPLPIMRNMRSAYELWPGADALRIPFRCDGSLVRKALSYCGEKSSDCPFTLNVRILRRYREKELLRKGLDADLLPLFLGLDAGASHAASSDALEQLRFFIHNENLLKSSARNIFYGEIVAIWPEGILDRILIETASGLKVEAIITETSRKNLGLSLGSLTMALVKAPWVKICQPDQQNPEKNCYQGKIEDIRTDGVATEILTRLPHGQLLCALYIDKRNIPVALAKGDIMSVSFSPLSVILASPK